MPSILRLEETISLEDVIDMHNEVINNSIGNNGLSGDKSLEAALFRIDNQIHYKNLSDPFEIAAWYGFAIARSHTFIDGNKRTAMTCMLSYLEVNNILVQFKENSEQLADYMENLAEGKIEIKDLIKWLRSSSPDSQ